MSDGDLYAWQELAPDGRWGTIAVIIPVISDAPVPLVSRSRETIAGPFRGYAESHRDATGHAVRLATFKLWETEEL